MFRWFLVLPGSDFRESLIKILEAGSRWSSITKHHLTPAHVSEELW